MMGGLLTVDLYWFCILSIETFMLLHVVSMECLGTINCKIKMGSNFLLRLS